ncbi:MAG TPA: radical SAM family heme chaperone HemW [Steroidobacteraceae bacterium]|jgi:oxygen-independent coproporphyrinogen-3 oxidase|nr:radical SAM family heme chaperone HemW [Steroidobacteraceae bacterium]
MIGASQATRVPLALYVHLPWCVRKCPYCDFNSHQLKAGRPDASYIDALMLDFEMELARVRGRRIDSVFFGGGTPSLFQPEDFARLLAGLRQRLDFAADAEITLEANPGTIERGRFAGYAQAGITRVSLGAQSFDAPALKVLGRIHSADDTHRAVEELRSAKLGNFNLDLMYALPGQTLEAAENDVRIACSLQPSHISYYQLTLEPGTVFYSRPPLLPDEDAAWQIQLAGQKLLADAGYDQYEVSAYAREGAQCRHNLNYWLFGDYVGIGAGAHGKISLELPAGILRTSKPKQPRDYQDRLVRAVPTGEAAYIGTADLPFEFMLNALRLNAGFDRDCYRARTGLELGFIEEKLQRARDRGLLEPTPRGWRPTTLGRRFLNDLQASFLA